ncbi:MAG TPA: repressor LexA [Epulopiscium sp.]|nr:repressor LexA [Candidatus Epulonipiscium sp.]
MDAKDRIKELRTSKGWTLEELGNKLGVGRAAVHKWENGQTTNLKRSTIEKLSELFDVNPSYIMGMSDIMKTLPSFNKIPLLGTIAAGLPILAEENIEDYFNIDSKLKADFALRIKGNSMINAGINENDIVFIRKQDWLESGEIGAILIEGEATLKKFHKDNGTIILQAENKSYAPMVYTNGNLRILGKLVAVLSLR